jgi:hypothetical protein
MKWKRKRWIKLINKVFKDRRLKVLYSFWHFGLFSCKVIYSVRLLEWTFFHKILKMNWNSQNLPAPLSSFSALSCNLRFIFSGYNSEACSTFWLFVVFTFFSVDRFLALMHIRLFMGCSSWRKIMFQGF